MAEADEVMRRLQRIYGALGETVEGDLSKFPPVVASTEKFVAIFQDFVGGLDQAALDNLAHAVIHNIANFNEHLTRWAQDNERHTAPIDNALTSSPELQLIKDLSNNDKHGYPLRYSRSGKSPRLREVGRRMRLSTGATKGSSISMTLGPNGPIIRASEGASASVVVTATIEDGSSEPIGDLYETEVEALRVLEEAAREMGVPMDAE